MAYLVFTDDEIALMRFTCDLFFVEESPLYFLEEERRAPQDYEASYRSLIEKGALDPRGFRINDDALNRLAPMTECDARVVAIRTSETGEVTQEDYYVLEEIAVQYLPSERGHALGRDLDRNELVEYLGRRMVPRAAEGERFDTLFSPIEYAAFALIVRKTPKDKKVQVGFSIPTRLLDAVLGPAPAQDSAQNASNLMHMLRIRKARDKGRRKKRGRFTRDENWDAALTGLLDKGVFTLEDDALKLRPALYDFARALANHKRDTFVRYDFGDGEWLMRETSFISCEGSLYAIGPVSKKGLRVRELDGRRLRKALRDAVGPLQKNKRVRPAPPAPTVAKPVLDESDGDTEVALALPSHLLRGES